MSKSRSPRGNASSLRLLRVGENVRHAISTILARGDIQDPDLMGASITVSEVRVSTDLRNATIFVMPLGGDENNVVTKALNRNSPFIRGQLGKMVTMRFMPQLKFKKDDSFDEASNINALLQDPRVQRDLAKPDNEPSDENE